MSRLVAMCHLTNSCPLAGPVASSPSDQIARKHELRGRDLPMHLSLTSLATFAVLRQGGQP